ncbi:MAG: cupin domain-containing protein [Marinilabiliales bacterium]|nr:cupin domain-containing protein [Marinilabiliales bacterium]
MKALEKISENKFYSAVNMGDLKALSDYSLVHPITGRVIEGKVFLKDATAATGTEISFNALPPHAEQPYFHLHRKNEETYIILSGSGFFQVDEDCFAIKSGSVIRVAPQGKRGIRNEADEAMIYLVIQSREHSLEEHTTADGERVPVEPKWR